MRVLVLGSGAREHALMTTIARSPLVDAVFAAPGNPGMAECAETSGGRILTLDLADMDASVRLAHHLEVGLVVVGPEAPLAAGIADRLEGAGIAVFGPSRVAAELEWSKSFAKEFMARHRIPTAAHLVFDDADRAAAYAREQDRPLVVKADGLAAGKGVFVCDAATDALAAIDEIMRERRFGSSGARVVIEERLRGPEVSFHAISDGERFLCLDPAQDFKRALDGDRGENTGGMGAYAPVPFVDDSLSERIVSRVVRPVLEGMRAEGRPYRGVLYCGLMLQDGEPQVIEFNSRFGDPEAQALLPRLESDLVPYLLGAAQGALPEEPLRSADHSVCVVLASEGYPRSYPTGLPIEGLEILAGDPNLEISHAGTQRVDGRLETGGGRVLAVTARGETLERARERAYDAVAQISFKGVRCRSDIALRALAVRPAPSRSPS